MKQKMLFFNVAVGTLGAFSAFLLWKLWRENRELKSVVQLLRFRNASRGPEIAVKSLFFPDDRIICRNLLIDSCGDVNCSYSHDENAPLTQIVRLIQSARESIDLALFEITSEELSDAICQKLESGVRVRLIIDSEYMMVTGTKLQQLTSSGCAFLHDHSTGLFHHKFCIIDDQVVLSGSLNWTRQAVIGNYENVIVIKHAETAQRFCQEYERMWEKIGNTVKENTKQKIAQLKGDTSDHW